MDVGIAAAKEDVCGTLRKAGWGGCEEDGLCTGGMYVVYGHVYVYGNATQDPTVCRETRLDGMYSVSQDDGWMRWGW